MVQNLDPLMQRDAFGQGERRRWQVIMLGTPTAIGLALTRVKIPLAAGHVGGGHQSAFGRRRRTES